MPRCLVRTSRLVAAALLLTAAWPGVLRAQAVPAPPCGVQGRVGAGTFPLPGVAVTVAAGGQVIRATSTGPDGSYRVALPGPGSYVVRLDLTGFTPAERAVRVEAASCRVTLDIALTLQSRAAPAAPSSTPKTPSGASAPPPRPNPPVRVRGAGAAAPASPAGLDQAGAAEDTSSDEAARLLLPPGFSPDAPTESVTSVGTAGQLDNFLLFGAGRETRGLPGEGGFGAGADGQGPLARAIAAGDFGGFGPGGFGGGGFGRGGFGGRLREGNRLRLMAFDTLGGSALDAQPYSLNGQPSNKAGYLRQRFGLTMGGPFSVPKLVDGQKTTFFLNYTGNHSTSQYDAYSTVPTAAMRAGDLSALSAPVYDPATGQPFPNNQIPASRLDPSALALLALYPQPNQPGDRQNYHYVTTSTVHQDDVNFRLIRSFGGTPARRGGFRGGFGGRGGGFGGPGGGHSLSVGVHFSRSSSVQPNLFPGLGGSSLVKAWDVPVAYSFTAHGIVNRLQVHFSRRAVSSSNQFAYSQDVAGGAGIAGVATDPFDWGAPTISLSSVTGLRDPSPSRRTDQTFELSDMMVKTLGRHAIRWGGNFEALRTDTRADANAMGSFVFTGLYTAGPLASRSIAGSGLDFADFLLGLPQQASIQYGPGLERFRGRSWAAFLQDDWRITGALTLNYGLRYEYVSPYTEAGNRLVTLDGAPGFTAAVPVTAGGIGPYAGVLPDSLVKPDRNNFAPRVGLAWRVRPDTIVRGGYGINYNAGVYASIAQQLAAQPPFATSATSLGTAAAPLALSDPFASITSETTTNTYGIDPSYRLGYVQIWNLDIQRTIGRTVFATIGYTGTRGSSLDLLRAPNRGPDGLLVASVPPFVWETSGGRSVMHALTLRLRKRLTHGLGGGVTYTWSKSMDDASSVGGGAAVVAQNDRNLAAEWGLSSFDQPQRFAGDVVFELPFGPEQRWLNNDGWAAKLLGGWQWTANVTLASGLPFTARVLGAVTDVGGGTNGTLRADYSGAPIPIADPTVQEYFDTAAFSVPAPGTFGNAGRNTIRGPGTTDVDMSLGKDIVLDASGRALSLRVQATNVFNLPQFSVIDTVVNSPTFGRVIAARPMRSVQIVTRFRF